MSILDQLRVARGRRRTTNIEVTPPSQIHDPEKSVAQDAPTVDKEGSIPSSSSSADLGPEAPPDTSAQRGVQKIEAITTAWTRWSLAALLINIWLIFLTNGFRIAILYSLQPYAASDFRSHSLITAIDVVVSSITATCYVPIAKLLDVWGRAETFLLMIGCSTLGVILMASSSNLATYCAAQVFYAVGFAGIIYTVAVLAADVTSLKNRGIAFAFTSSPYMITAFAGSEAAQAFLLHVNWRWGFGAFAIIVPIITLPLFILLKVKQRTAEKSEIIRKGRSTAPVIRQIWDGIVQFDIPGVILLAGGLVVFLLPFTLATSAPNGWKTDYIIAMIVVGFVLLVFFALYEMYLAKEPFLEYRFLTDRNILGACLINFTYQISYYCWASYFTSFLQVVTNLSVAKAGYVNSTFQVVSGVNLFIVGFIIRATGRYKWLFFVCIPLYIFGVGLMIHFRQPNQYIGYIVMCEIFMSVGGSVFILLTQLAVLATVNHQSVAAALALLYVTGGVGDAVGNAISGAIWTNTFYKALVRNLPPAAAANATTIYASLPAQLSYPVNSPERIGIQRAYGYGQTRMLAVGTGVMALSFIWACMVRNVDVSKKTSQTKGIVF